MNNPNDNKKAVKAQDAVSTQFYGASDVAKIIGVTRQNVAYWHKQGLFTADLRTHDGRYLYEVERVMQLKSVYHPNWMRGGYEPSPTTDEPEHVHTQRTLHVEKSKPVEDSFVPPAVVKKRNVQVYPSKVIYFPNDRFAKKLSTLTNDDFSEMNSGESRKLVEFQQHRKFGKIVSPFRIYVDEHASFTLSEPVEQFDFDVLCVCISEYHIGNRYVTPGIIYRALTGKVDDRDANPSKDQFAAIINSTEKLMFLKTQINMTDYCKKLNCNAGHPFEILAPLLPAKRITATVNGGKSIVIQLVDESPLWQVACLKNQFMSFDAKLLNVPGQQNTKMNIELKNYVLRRIVEIKAHRQLASILTFDDLFFKCRIENASRQKKTDARETVVTFLEHLQKEKFIKSFDLIKHGNSFYSVKFTCFK